MECVPGSRTQLSPSQPVLSSTCPQMGLEVGALCGWAGWALIMAEPQEQAGKPGLHGGSTWEPR